MRPRTGRIPRVVFRAERGVFADRAEAGSRVAVALGALPPDALILGIPRGGVVVARAIADALGLPLDVVVTHKLGAPGNPELAVGAIGPDGEAMLDPRVLEAIGGVSDVYLRAETERQVLEIHRRLERFRAGRDPIPVAGRTCVLVDDGIATGSTARAAIRWLRRQAALPVILAVPVAPAATAEALAAEADEVLCLLRPLTFYAVGQWYERFEEVTDEQVIEALAGSPAA